MDKKGNQLIEYYYKKFKERTFDEKDVSNFLILVRESVRGIKSIRELGDFIAHREKDKGFVQEYLQETERILNNLGKINTVLKIQEVFSFKEIKNGFNTLFRNKGFEKLPNDTINDIVLCIISLLQDVKLLEQKSKREIGNLCFAISSKQVFLMGNIKILNNGKYVNVQFPVLSTKNIYEKIKPLDSEDTPYSFSKEIIDVVNINGKMVITFPNAIIKG